ncbi:MAG: hypothetical protein KAW12_05885 [Candidatus Aminicenantes bacterium]|nr:hypothetical protein [Candidatus Aminicenantes bacterium]
MANKPVFIHSLFRTGSTYIWNKFRQSDRYCCYYEPFHHIFSHVDTRNLKDALTKNFNAVKHPRLDKYYLFEYEQVIEAAGQVAAGSGHSTPVGEAGPPRAITPSPTGGAEGKGMPYFKKSFSFDEFCFNGDNPDLKAYIDFLIAAAGDKTPLFQFNRSSLRTGWFRDNYPGSLNFYLARNPRHQWQSYIELYERTHYLSFFVMDLLIAGINEDSDGYRVLSRHLPLIKYEDCSVNHEISFYQLIQDAYSPEEQYLIFYYTWFLAFIENVCRADSVISIDLLCADTGYREDINARFKDWGIQGVNFADCKIPTYSRCALPVKTMENIESKVQKMLLTALSPEKFATLLDRLPSPDAGYFGFRRDKFLRYRSAKLKKVTTPQQAVEKYRQMVVTAAKELFRQIDAFESRENRLQALQGIRLRLDESTRKLEQARDEKKELQRRLKENEAQREKMAQANHALREQNRAHREQVRVMRNSLSWKLTAPFRRLNKLIKPRKK